MIHRTKKGTVLGLSAETAWLVKLNLQTRREEKLPRNSLSTSVSHFTLLGADSRMKCFSRSCIWASTGPDNVEAMHLNSTSCTLNDQDDVIFGDVRSRGITSLDVSAYSIFCRNCGVQYGCFGVSSEIPLKYVTTRNVRTCCSKQRRLN